MKRILFVDDNPDILLALIDYFSNRDWITDSCGNGKQRLICSQRMNTTFWF